ncbi:hypothetical protein GF354_05890, partial [Candidatus Peregrinibacteria bacterium]|nr:hypothetical protein [Candidatus Peregrinibacteria bacterium]
MTALLKYKQPVEISFHYWIKAIPEPGGYYHNTPLFLKFAKTVLSFHAKKWKDTNYLEERILTEKPEFDQKELQEILILFEHLINFHETKPLPRTWYIEKGRSDIPPGHYLEVSIKNG